MAVVTTVVVYFPIRYRDSVTKYSQKFGVERSVVYAVIHTESKFDSQAVSKSGAIGLMQLMPSTARWLAEQLNVNYADDLLFDSDYNIMLGVYYLRYLRQNFCGDDVYAAYNAGEGKVREWQGVVRYKETKDYIDRVKAARAIYAIRLG